MLRALAALTLALLTLAGCGRTTTSSTTSDRASPAPSATRAARTPSASVPPALSRLPARRATVWAVGDGADGGHRARGLARLIVAGRPALFLYLGDVYESGTAAEFAAHYDRVYGSLARRTAPTPGNHDYPRRGVGYGPYWRRKLGGPVPSYYALDIAGWQLLSLNSEGPHDPSSAQIAWLRRRMRGTGTCRIAFWHRPRFSAGLHGDEIDVAPLWTAVAGRAALVLNGHDHTSQRLKPIAGTTEIVAGGGGHRPYPVNAGEPRLAYSSTGAPAALELRLGPGAARITFWSVAGRRLDTHTVRCRRGA